ncbi:MAG: alanine dehydrogenase, partial [Proteobacteria bacterium]|nr:alanine dehydrogenase [Pseudomonadota bacterium]
MRIGIPKEIKTLEGRVALVPDAVLDLIKAGHELHIQSEAGLLSGFSDRDYEDIGAVVEPDAEHLYGSCEMIVKVKEPVADDIKYLREDHLLFCYLHLAAEPELTTSLLDIGLTGVAFETVELDDGSLPLLAPMSIIAGKISTQVGTHLLHRPAGGKGVLLGGLASTERGNVVVLGGGAAGGHAASLAASIGANVVVFDKRQDRLSQMMALGSNVTALYPYQQLVADTVAQADLVVGAVLIPGAKAPHVVSESMIKMMEPGSVVADISIDQGGCIETSKATTWNEPTYEKHEVVHFTVTNMPGAVPRTATYAISAAILPYVLRLATADWYQVEALQRGVNVKAGQI